MVHAPFRWMMEDMMDMVYNYDEDLILQLDSTSDDNIDDHDSIDSLELGAMVDELCGCEQPTNHRNVCWEIYIDANSDAPTVPSPSTNLTTVGTSTLANSDAHTACLEAMDISPSPADSLYSEPFTEPAPKRFRE